MLTRCARCAERRVCVAHRTPIWNYINSPKLRFYLCFKRRLSAISNGAALEQIGLRMALPSRSGARADHYALSVQQQCAIVGKWSGQGRRQLSRQAVYRWPKRRKNFKLQILKLGKTNTARKRFPLLLSSVQINNSETISKWLECFSTI